MTTTPILSLVAARRGHFELESGHHGDLWLDLETLCLQPRLVQPFAAEIAERLRPYRVDAVCGPLNEGAFVALLVASALECDFTYAERFPAAARGEMFGVAYRLPAVLRKRVEGRRVAIVNDVISAGSAVRGTFRDLRTIGAEVVAIASLVVLGEGLAGFARDHDITLEALVELPYNLWTPPECPLCRDGLEVESPAT